MMRPGLSSSADSESVLKPIYWPIPGALIGIVALALVGSWYFSSREDFPLRFAHSSAQLIIDSGFSKFKADLLSQGRSDQRLTITGLQYSDEQSIDGVEVGYLRAQATLNQFANDLPIEQLGTAVEKLPTPAPKNQQLEAVRFNWQALTVPVPQLAQLELPAGFRRGSSDVVVGSNFAEFVRAFGSGSTGQQMQINGAYFDGENEALGLARANALRALFMMQQQRPVEDYIVLATYQGPQPADEVFSAAHLGWVNTGSAP